MDTTFLIIMAIVLVAVVFYRLTKAGAAPPVKMGVSGDWDEEDTYTDPSWAMVPWNINHENIAGDDE